MSRTLASGRIGDLGITKALHLYGTSTSNVDVGQQTFLDGKPFTFCTRHWPTATSMAYDGCIFGYGFSAGTNKGYAIRADSTTRKVTFFYAGGTGVTTTNFRLVGSMYIFVDFDGVSTGHVYKNTTLMDTLTGIVPNVSDPAVHTFIGTRDTSARFSIGVFGDSAIYSRLLTAAERQNIVTRAVYPSGAEVMYKMNDESSTIHDYSGNGRDGTMASGLWRNSPFNAYS